LRDYRLKYAIIARIKRMPHRAFTGMTKLGA
jgi:hypothetical protein